MPNDTNSLQPMIKSQFFEDHNKDISFFYTGKNNVLGRDYSDGIIANTRNASYIRIGRISFDKTLQPNDENIVQEEFILRMENYISSQYKTEDVTVKIAGHIIGKRVNRTKFKCIITPGLEYDSVPDIHVTEELTSEGYIIGIWLNTTGTKRVFVKKINSNARNSYPVDDEYIDSKYYMYFLKNSDMVYDVDTTNILANITRNEFIRGVNIYDGIDLRLNRLEAIQYPDFKFAYINTDSSWVPVYSGNQSKSYQRIPLVNADYGLASSNPFLRIETATTKGFLVLDEGLYQIQYTCGISADMAMEDNVVETCLTLDGTPIPGTSITRKLIGSNDITKGNIYNNPYGMGSGTVLLHLRTTNIIRLEFKFLEGYKGGIKNNGSKILVTKLLQMP